MSYPGGFSKLYISDEGTQRMATGEGNVGHPANEDLHSKSEAALSRVDAARVITWLRPIREFRVDAFWKKFSFPPNIRVSFPSSGSHYVDCTDGDRGGMNSIYWMEIDISEGLRSPLPP